jgi:hypothetical protein
MNVVPHGKVANIVPVFVVALSKKEATVEPFPP